jgi:glyoxylase-like metal-dependent hydrolase (beta-lactamase superfamily II)
VNLTDARTAWFRTEQVSRTITRIEEPHVHALLQANVWHVVGSDRDLVVDAGLGVASLRENVPALFRHDPILVLTHAHLDHVGSAHEFEDRRMHRATRVDERMPATLDGPRLAELLGLDASGMPALLLDGVPPGFDPQAYGIPPAPATRLLEDGDVVDLGDRVLQVLHLPGHTEGSICLFDPADGSLFSGDVIYDDVLLDELHESDIDDYVRSMRRLRALPVRIVYPGHGAPFDGDRMRQIVDAYLAGRSDQGLPHHPGSR